MLSSGTTFQKSRYVSPPARVAEAIDLAKHSFATWTGGAPPVINVPPPQPVGPDKVFMVNRPHAAQTFVAEILPGPARNSPDYFSLSFADAVWGHAVGARLNMNIRKDKGYSYGVFPYLTPYEKYGMWRASGGVQTNKAKESVVEFEKELNFMAGEKPITDKELTDARHNRVRGYAQQFESGDRVAEQIEKLWTFGLPMIELQHEPNEFEKATLASVNAAARNYAKPSGATLLLVGDLSKIEPGIRELNLGETVLLDVEGYPLPKK
jgi:zinc protease